MSLTSYMCLSDGGPVWVRKSHDSWQKWSRLSTLEAKNREQHLNIIFSRRNPGLFLCYPVRLFTHMYQGQDFGKSLQVRNNQVVHIREVENKIWISGKCGALWSPLCNLEFLILPNPTANVVSETRVSYLFPGVIWKSLWHSWTWEFSWQA